MTQPFSFSNYARLLLRRWPLIVIPLLIAVGVAVTLGLLTPRAYTATATLITPRALQTWRFDARLFDTVDIRYDPRVDYMPLLATEDTAQRALDGVQGQLSQPLTADQLLAATRTRMGEGTLFDVSVTLPNAQDAALLANALAAALPAAVADFFGGDASQYQQAADDALAKQAEWDRKLAEFRAQTGLGVGYSSDLESNADGELFGAHNALMQELVLKNSERAALQDAIDRIDLTVQSVQNDPQNFTIQLLDLPELTDYGLDYESLQAQRQTDPDALLATLAAARTAIAADLTALTDVTIPRQRELSDGLNTLDNLLRDRGVWMETATTMLRKVAEVEMQRIVEGQRVQIVDEATVPAQPSQPNWPLSLGIAIVGGLLFGLLLAVAAAYLGDSRP